MFSFSLLGASKTALSSQRFTQNSPLIAFHQSLRLFQFCKILLASFKKYRLFSLHFLVDCYVLNIINFPDAMCAHARVFADISVALLKTAFMFRIIFPEQQMSINFCIHDYRQENVEQYVVLRSAGNVVGGARQYITGDTSLSELICSSVKNTLTYLM